MNSRRGHRELVFRRGTVGDEAAIRKADQAYVQAFNKHDAKVLADAWSPEAVYLNRVTGAEVLGRAAIAEQFTAIFKDQPEVKLDLNVQSIQFVSPNVAVEQGIAKTLAPKAEPEEEEYSAVFVARGAVAARSRDGKDQGRPSVTVRATQTAGVDDWPLGRQG